MTPIKAPPRPKPAALRIELLGIEPLIWQRVELHGVERRGANPRFTPVRTAAGDGAT